MPVNATIPPTTVTTNTTTGPVEAYISGVYALDIVRTAGTATASLEISLDNGANYVQFTDANGTDVTVDMSGTTRHYRHEFLAQPGTRFQVVTTGASGGASITVQLTRIVSE